MIRTFSRLKINSVLKHPDIWPNIADDQDFATFQPPVTKDIHYLFETGVIFILHPLDDDLEIHANIVPAYRGNAAALANEALRYGFDLNDRIVARIPARYENVLRFAHQFMNETGIIGDIHHFSLMKSEHLDRAALLGG